MIDIQIARLAQAVGDRSLTGVDRRIGVERRKRACAKPADKIVINALFLEHLLQKASVAQIVVVADEGIAAGQLA